MEQILFKNISKKFGDTVILDNLNISIPKGQNIAIIGGSGTGKSVLLKCLLGLLTPETGEILVDGNNMVNARNSLRRKINEKIGVVFQNGALFDSMSVVDNIMFGLCTGQKVPKETAYPIAIEALRKVGLKTTVAEKFPAELSGGMRKRVALARAIATSPEIILFDEPTTGLDPITTHTIDKLIQTTVKELGITAITVTHDIQSMMRIADNIALLYQGKIVWQGTPKDIKESDNTYIKQFISGNTDGPIDWAKADSE